MDPATTAAAIKALAKAKQALDTAALRRAVEQIQIVVYEQARQVDAIGKQLADEIIVQLLAGYDHLAVAVNADGDLRREELRLARENFVKLANRSGGGMVIGTAGAIHGDEVAALGHLGNYHYFLLSGEQRQALIEAYRCTERFPTLGVYLFPMELFSRDYRSALAPYETRRKQLEEAHRSARTKYYKDQEKIVKRRVAAEAFKAGLGRRIRSPLPPSDEALVAHRAEVEKVLAPLAVEAHERRVEVEANRNT